MPAAAGVSNRLPLVAFAPLQAGVVGVADAVQLVASIVDQLSAVDLPRAIEAAANDSVGTTSAESA